MPTTNPERKTEKPRICGNLKFEELEERTTDKG
jgi:hypothetical protein